MSTELRHLTPIEKELRCSQWCRSEGIKRFLFDLDDTICPTRSVFREVMSQAYDFLAANAPVVSREKWKEEVETTNNRLFEELGVNSNRWNHVVDELAGKYFLSEDIKQKTKQVFQLIYTTPLAMVEGAEAGLGFIKKMEIPIGIVTHAGLEWTWKKYNWLALRRFIEWDDVFIVDENKHKTSESWVQAIRYFGLSAEECAVVGDSPRSDINPAWEAGVRHCFLVEDPRQWSVHNQPVDPSVKKN
jgi:FMN phosphatase YigB (HAD superfamily)